MNFPENFIDSLCSSPGFSKEQFITAHQQKSEFSVRVNPGKPTQQFNECEKVPWCDHAYYLKEKPEFIFDPLLHAGAYYVQEASSMFLWTVLKHCIGEKKKIKALDLCGAPGGKSTLISTFIGEEGLLVSNEVIKSRAGILNENLVKWGNGNSIICSNDPSAFSSLENFFDLVVADAPCSGSGMFRKDPVAMKEWSADNVNLCSQRQKRILSSAFSCLQPGGILVYSTCSYSKEENEDILDWIKQETGWESVRIPIEENWGIVESRADNSGSYGYRFYPGKVRGEGFFISAFRNNNEPVTKQQKRNLKLSRFTKKEEEILGYLVNTEDTRMFVQGRNGIYSVNANFENEISLLKENLYVLNSGIYCGEIIRDEIIPSHHLAMSGLLKDEIPFIEAELEGAIQFLRKENCNFEAARGWNIVRYKKHRLGWIKSLGPRCNNYYPKEYRILKEFKAR